MSGYSEFAIADARLVILRSLSGQTDYRLNETLISRTLETFGHNWPREKVRDQLRWLADMGAVTLTEAGSILIAAITRRGLDHVERRAVIEGVARRSPEA